MFLIRNNIKRHLLYPKTSYLSLSHINYQLFHNINNVSSKLKHDIDKIEIISNNNISKNKENKMTLLTNNKNKISTDIEDIDISNKQVFQLGRLALQADSSIEAFYGDTMILVTAINEKNTNIDEDNLDLMLPLSVEYRERYYASGRIPKAIQRRERGGTSDIEILNARVIDRILRPLFPKDYIDETQIIATLHSFDGLHDPIIPTIHATSLSLMLNPNIPWNGPIGCCRIGLINDEFILNPNLKQLKEESILDILYAGTIDRTLMIEANGNEIPEKKMIEGLKFAHSHMKECINSQLKLIEKIAKKRLLKLNKNENNNIFNNLLNTIYPINRNNYIPSNELLNELKKKYYNDINLFFEQYNLNKKEKSKLQNNLFYKIRNELKELYPNLSLITIELCIENLIHDILSSNIINIKNSRRLDGRTIHNIRPLYSDINILSQTHGSSIFQRGETQVLCTVTLGSDKDELVELSLTDETTKFFLHYDFPPYSVNEIGRINFTNRRMIGHGKLAEKALIPLIPSFNEFPYTIRLHSEVTSSNGSSSQATICGSSLALMDAGVPIKEACAGISIGLVTELEEENKEDNNNNNNNNSIEKNNKKLISNYFKNKIKEIKKHKLLVDITGFEDHFADMDFKIGGTKNGITAIQLDVKLEGGVPLSILCSGIMKANIARNKILKNMNDKISKSRNIISKLAPPIEILQITPEKIEELKRNQLQYIYKTQEKFDCDIRLVDEGDILIYAETFDIAKKVKNLMAELCYEIKIGDIFEGEIKTVGDFGAIVTILGNREGILHVTELSNNDIDIPTKDVLEVGQKIKVKCINVDEIRGHLKLSRKALFNDKNYNNKNQNFNKKKNNNNNNNNNNNIKKKNNNNKKDKKINQNNKNNNKKNNKLNKKLIN